MPRADTAISCSTTNDTLQGYYKDYQVYLYDIAGRVTAVANNCCTPSGSDCIGLSLGELEILLVMIRGECDTDITLSGIEMG